MAFLLLLLLIVLVLRALYVLLQIGWCRKHHKSFCAKLHSKDRPIPTLIVLGSGGHTTEVLALLASLDPEHYAPVAFCMADTDTTSVQRLTDRQRTETEVYDIPRSREVGQSYLTSVWTTLRAQLSAFGLVYRVRPQLVLCNGPGTCLPVCTAALFLRIIGVIPNVRVVFVESLCRVQTLSLTGRLLYLFADVFCVHWPELQRRFPDSRRIRTFVEDTDGKKVTDQGRQG